MSLLFKPNSARLSVIGNGWNNVSFDSGGGFVFDDLLWKDIALDLKFEFDPNIDFGELNLPEFDFSDIIFELDGVIYTEMDGAWRNPLTGELYPGGGDMWMTENLWLNASGVLGSYSTKLDVMKYNIPPAELEKMYRRDLLITKAHIKDAGYHYFSTPCHIWLEAGLVAYFFSSEGFKIFENNGHLIFDNSATNPKDKDLIGENTFFYEHQEFARYDSNYIGSRFYTDFVVDVNGKTTLISDIPSFPDYSDLTEGTWEGHGTPVRWAMVMGQCLYGSYENRLDEFPDNMTFVIKDTTITTDQIKNGTSGLESREYDGKTYYKV